MVTRRNYWLNGIMLLVLSLLLAACGGKGEDARTSGVVDPAPSYAGVTTQAAVNSSNAEDLALGGFAGNNVAESVGSFSLAGKVATSQQPTVEYPVRELAQTLKLATRRMNIPVLAQQRQQAKPVAGTPVAAQQTITQQIVGPNGGVINYTLEVNDTTGSFYGTLDFQGYASDGASISGTAEMLGSFDSSRQQLSRLTLSFKSLTMSGSGYSFTLVGTLSWGFNYAALTETLSINMVLKDGSNNRTCWFNNYELTTTYGSTSVTQSVRGRYYDPIHGYVDFTTTTPLVTTTGNRWPSQGVILFTGRNNTSVRLTFATTSLLIEADTDGNGTIDWQSQRQTNSPPPINPPPPTNSAPVANAGPDLTVSQWSTVQLDGSASSDADNDPLTYYWYIDSYPPNGYPALTGGTTATPSFVAEQAGTYQFRLMVYDGTGYSSADTVTVTVTPAVGSAPNLLQKQWEYGLYGTSIGRAGLFTVDLDGDGTREIVASASPGGFGSNSYWYIVRKAAGGTYEQIWRSRQYGATVVRMVLADLTGDGKDDIVVGLSDGTVYVYDGPTRQEVVTFKATGTMADLAVGDLDGDGAMEIITSDGIGVAVYAADGSGLLWSLASGGGNSVAVGNVDADAALEIVTTTSGGKGYVIDGGSRTIDWEYINSFGAQVKLADLDGDGMQEIVGAAAWYKITVFDVDRKSPAWEKSVNLDIASVLIADIDGDGSKEILYGDNQGGTTHAIDTVTKAEKWSISCNDSGVSGIALGDLDNDGANEILWGAGGSSTGPDHLYVANPATKAVEWQSKHVDGPLSAVAVGDVDDDGDDEIVMVSFESDSGYAEGIIHIFNARTHAIEYQEKLGIMDWMGVRSVKIGDVDGDGKTEFVVTTGNVYDGVIRVYNGATHLLKRQSAGYNGNFFSALAIGDVDGDGKTEIVAGQGKEHTGATGTYLIVFDGATLQEKWRSVDLGNGWGSIYDVKLADLNNDGHVEICASVSGANRLVVYDGVNHDLKLLIEHPSRALAIADVDADGALELLAGRTDGKIDVFSGSTFALKATVATFGKTPVDALRIADLDNDGTPEWLLTSAGLLTVLDGTGQGLKWRSTDLSGNLGLYNHLEVRDTNGNGKPELFVGANSAIYQFEGP